MRFWAIEVKPGRSYILSNDETRRLHISEATLGYGTVTSSQSILQCKVGDMEPVYLCSLLPNKETCTLDLEFEEDEEVSFSIIGSQSVHLFGFVHGDESNDDVKIEEIVDYEKPTNEDGLSKRVNKKKSKSSMPKGDENSTNQIVPKAGTSVPIVESEDGEGFPVHAHDKKSGVSKSEANLDETEQENIGHKSQNKSEEPDAASRRNLKRKRGAVNQDEQPARETESQLDSSLENGKPDSVVMEESPVSEAGNDAKPSSEKKKEKKTKKQNKPQENAQTLSAEKKVADKNESDLEEKERGAAKSLQVRILPNGLIIEELAMGKPGGMIALQGKKVSITFTGKLMGNDENCDSSRSGLYKFCIGTNLVIKGLNFGVEGMRVGDIRRLTIPPKMGYGVEGAQPDIPPNALLIYEVKLVQVTQ